MYEYRTASVLAFTETWLNENDSNDALHIDGFGSPLRLDRDSALTGKHHGGGVCIYVNTNWCSSDKSLKGFDQYIDCTTRFGKTLDKCYGSIPNAYRAVPPPPQALQTIIAFCLLQLIYL